MTPPALIIAGGAVIAVGSIVAFHQFVYEPHIAPKLEVFVENWLEQRRLRRRQLARPVSFGDDGDMPSGSRATSQVEMDTISVPLTVSSIDAGLSEATLRRRSNATRGHDSFVLESPNVFVPFGTLAPLSNAGPLPGVSSPHFSTPSTVPSSLLELHSPSRTTSPAARSYSDHSRRSSTDSILAEDAINHLSFATISPTHSVTHISPRALLVPIVPPAGINNDEDSRPLSDFTRARLAPARSPTQSLMNSTIYESFAPSISPVAVSDQELLTARALLFPPGQQQQQRAPRSTASWSDFADSDEEPEFLVGSDLESWASMSDGPT